MSHERFEERREITFYGSETKVLIQEGLKLATLRVSNPKYSFKRGERVKAHYDNIETSSNIVVLDVLKEKPLDEIDLALLPLDGYFSHREAVEDIRYYYQDVDLKTDMDYVVFMPERFFNGLDQDYGGKLLELPVSELIKKGKYQALFFTSIYYWAWNHSFSEDDFARFLEQAELV